jgi:hypothetical protein
MGRILRDLGIGVLAAVVGYVIICVIVWAVPTIAALTV